MHVICDDEYGPSKSRIHSVVGYVSDAQARSRESMTIKFGQCAMLYRVLYEGTEEAREFVVLEPMPIARPRNEAERVVECIPLTPATRRTGQSETSIGRALQVVAFEDLKLCVYVTPGFFASNTLQAVWKGAEKGHVFINRFYMSMQAAQTYDEEDGEEDVDI